MEIIIGLTVVFIIVLLIYVLMFEKPKQIDHLPKEFVVFDLETTGLDPLNDEIIEIAAIRVKRGEKDHQTLTALVRPSKQIPKKITQLTGITQDMVERDGEPLQQVLLEFAC